MQRDAISKLLAEHGLQVTSQRLDIAEYVLSRPQHLSADQILGATSRNFGMAGAEGFRQRGN